MKKILPALLLAVLLCGTAHAQQYVWANAYGLQENTEAGTFIREISSGYYLMLGFIRTPATDNESAETDLLMVKINRKTGGAIWAVQFGIPEWIDHGWQMLETAEGEFVVLASARHPETGFEQFYLVKINHYRQKLWQRRIALGDIQVRPNTLQETPDGGFLLEGCHRHDAQSDYDDVFIIKLDAEGREQWKHNLGTSRDHWTYHYKPLPDGRFIGAGTAWVPENGLTPGAIDLLIRLLDADGTQLSQWTVGDPARIEAARDIRMTADGGFIIAAHSRTKDNATDEYDLSFAKLAADGQVEWLRAYGRPGIEEWPERIDQTTDGGYLVYGSFAAAPFNWNQFILKLAADGSMQWQQEFRVTDLDDGRDLYVSAVREVAGGGYLLEGTYDSEPGVSSRLLVRLDTDGSILWQKKFGQTGYWPDPFQPTTDGGFILTGSTWNYGTESDDVIVLKLDGNAEIPTSDCDVIIDTAEVIPVPLALAPSQGQVITRDNTRPTDVCPVTVTDFELPLIIIDLEAFEICRAIQLKLTDYEAVAGDGTVDIVWATEQERFTDEFNIYRARSAEGPYQLIGTVAASGSATRGAAYSFTDDACSNGQRYYYRLEDVTPYGATQVHATLSARPNRLHRWFQLLAYLMGR